METFSALLALCAGNLPVTGEFPAQRPVTRSFDVFFNLRLNKRLNKQSWGWWFETPSRSLWRYCNDDNLWCSPFSAMGVTGAVQNQFAGMEFWYEINTQFGSRKAFETGMCVTLEKCALHVRYVFIPSLFHSSIHSLIYPPPLSRSRCHTLSSLSCRSSLSLISLFSLSSLSSLSPFSLSLYIYICMYTRYMYNTSTLLHTCQQSKA